MKLFNVLDHKLVVKVDKKGLRVEEIDKEKGRRSLWLVTYDCNPYNNKDMFCVKYRWQTVPIWHDTLAKVKQNLEGKIEGTLPEEAFELYSSYVLSEIIVKNY